MKIGGWSVAAMLALLAVMLIAIGSATAQTPGEQVKRGEYLAIIGGCGDCHTPWMMGPEGPVPDQSRMYSGHPEALVMPPLPTLSEGPWMGIFSGTFTAWAGPWGISYSRNLTPDKETGIGSWTEDTLLETIRTGRLLGKGRMILPPMPIENLKHMTVEDQRALFAYFQSMPAIANRVHEPAAPPEPAPK